MSIRISKIDLSKTVKLPVPNAMHFVWIGDMNKVNTSYVDIWKKINKDKKIFFWYDKCTSLCDLLNNSIRNFVKIKERKNIIKAALEISARFISTVFRTAIRSSAIINTITTIVAAAARDKT